MLLCGFALSSYTRAETYKRLLANQNQHAFHELAAAAREDRRVFLSPLHRLRHTLE